MVLRSLLETASRSGDAPGLTVGRGTSNALSDLVECPSHEVLVVASRATVARVPGARALLAEGAGAYHDVHPNPTTGQALVLSSVIDRVRPRVVVAVGGGSTIDLAKAARLVRPEGLRADPPRLVAVPTTAGTGSEVTPFATLYHDGKKVSLDRPQVRPDHAVLDAGLVTSCPPHVAAAAVLDALCHAIESLWNREATNASRRYAEAAANALTSGNDWANAETGERRLLAATVAGIAIAHTRTTAAHAFSYWLTAQHAVAHGFACAVNLVWLARYNWDARDHHDRDLERVLRRLGCHPGAHADTPVPTVTRALDAAQRAGLTTIPRLAPGELSAYVSAGVAVRERADRNPVRLDPDHVRARIVASGLLTADLSGGQTDVR